MIVRLFNGAKTKEAWNPNSPEFIDDWKPEELVIKCDAVQMTYGSHVKVHVDDDMIEFFWDKDGFIEHNGVFYGDFIVDNDTN
jgi:hypothetical protein